MLKSIHIQYIKGIADQTFTLNLNPNKPALLVAPNGFGKSSFAVAFNSLKSNKIELHKDHFHKNDETLSPLLEVTCQNNGNPHTFMANSTSNTISGQFGIIVINSLLKSKAVQGFAGRRPTANLEIESITLVDTIPKNVGFKFSPQSIKTAWGKNGKILPNILNIFENSTFLSGVDAHYATLKKFNGTLIKRFVSKYKDTVNELDGTSDVISRQLTTNIPDVPLIHDLSSFLRKVAPDLLTTVLESFLASIIIGEFFDSDTQRFKKAVSYGCYLKEKESYEELIHGLNSTWCSEIKPKKAGKSLLVKFPKAHLISNGQRDILCFTAMLLRARRKLTKTDNILIFDEVFDYLDDANLISAQYYVSEFIKEMKDEGRKIYPLLLTHINPSYFESYAFKKPAIIYLDTSLEYTANLDFGKLLRKRNDKSDPLASDIEKFLLHYHTGTFDLENSFSMARLPQTWGRNSGIAFIKFLDTQKDQYFQGSNDYDPLAVCCSVRRSIEEQLFSCLTTNDTKTAFLETHGTKKKLLYLEDMGIDIPEYFYLLGIIYNDGLHWKHNQDNYSPVASKLNHTTIKHLIKNVFE